jgi:hypothetical protein
MVARQGERIKSHLTEKIYEIKAIHDHLVVLAGEDPSSRVFTDIENLNYFYEKIDPGTLLTFLKAEDLTARPGKDGTGDGNPPGERSRRFPDSFKKEERP